jgi:hypothetical protein
VRLPRFLSVIVAGLWLVPGLGGPTCAAQADSGSSVAGRVVDQAGRGVAAALVRIENAATGEHADAVSDLQGHFSFTDVEPGGYRLRVRAEGLSDWEADNLAVGLGTTAHLDAHLAPSWVHRTILVDAAVAQAGTEADARASEAGPAEMNQLPNNEQHWSSLAGLFSAAAEENDGSLSFRGLSPTMNSITIDGTDNNLAFRARERGSEGNGFAIAQSSVAGFQVNANGLAGYGRSAGGTVATVTKSGSNHLHGQAVFYDRGAIGQAFNAFSKTMVEEPAGTTLTSTGQPVLYLNGQPVTYVETPYHAPDRRQQWEVSAGGPIRRDRVFWFFAWEEHNRSDPAVARANEPEIFFAPPSATSLATLEARIGGSANPLLNGCPAAGSADSGSTARAECAWATVLNQLNGMLGTVPRSTRQTILFPRMDWRVNGRNQLTLEFNMMRRTSPHGALSGATETDAIGSFGNSSTSDDAAVARWEWFVTPQLMSSARYQYSRDVLSQTAGAASAFEKQFADNSWALSPDVSIDRSEGLSFGTLPTVNRREYPAETRQQLMHAITWIHGKQALRLGYEYNYVTDAIDGLNGENGEYSYSTMVDFLSDMLAPDSCDGTATGAGPYPCYSHYRQTVGFTNWSFETADYAGYVANEWRPTNRVTLTVGARYEYEQMPDTNPALVNPDFPETARLPHDRDELAPRAGFAWDLSRRGRTVLRGGAGVYYARVPNATVFSALTSTGSARSPRTYSYRPMDVGAPAFPYVFASDETPYVDPGMPDHNSSAPEVVYFDPHFRHPQINQAELSLEQTIGPNTVLAITGMATDGHHLTQFIDTNIDLANTATVFYSVVAPGNQGNAGPLAKWSGQVPGYTNIVYAPQRFYYQRLNPAYGAITDMVSESNSSYRGAMVRLVRRLSRSLNVNAGYTWAHAIDDNQNEATFADRNDVYDPADLSLEHGTSNYDVRQRVAGGIVVREPWHLSGLAGTLLGDYALAAAGTWRTGLPFSMRTLGAVPTPSCSYENWLNAGGATGDGANCLKTVTDPDETFTANTAGVPVPIAGVGASLNGSGGEDLIPPLGRNTFRYPAAANLDLRFTKRFRISDRISLEAMGEAFNTLNHQNVTDVQTIGYRLTNDTAHANMATLTWQSGVRPGTKTTLVNGSSQTQYVFDPTAAFGGVTSANSNALSRERQIQVGVRLVF